MSTVASATTELSDSISEVNRQVGLSTEIANSAAEQAVQSQQTVQNLVGTAQKIGDIMSLITSIADQTNLLALNATIEAACGRGW